MQSKNKSEEYETLKSITYKKLDEFIRNSI